MKNALYLLVAGLMVSVIIIGCSTEEPWAPAEVTGLELVIVSAPDTSTELYSGTSVSFSWSVTGGSGVIEGYRWYLEPLEDTWRDTANYTTTTYENVLSENDTLALDYVFHVEAIDSDGDNDVKTAEFTVLSPLDEVPDETAPTVSITQGPADESYVATGTSIAFAWSGDDGSGNDDMIEYQYVFPPLDDSSDWGMTTNVTFDDLPSANPAEFSVRAQDQAGNISDWTVVSFVIKEATILYVDDFYWAGDNPKERDQKQFYRDALGGFAYAEWDIAVQGIPTEADLAPYSTIVWCSDSEVGSEDGTWGDADLRDDMDSYLTFGGNLLLTGVWPLLDMAYVGPGENYYTFVDNFEYDWCGVDTSLIDAIDTTWWLEDEPYDTLVVSPDSVIIDTAWTWSLDYWGEFTWAVKDPTTTLDLPDSLKIDVAKNGDQLDYGAQVYNFRDDGTVTTDPIYTWGLAVDGEEGHAYGEPIGYIVNFSDTPQTAILNFDTYSMPLEGIRQTFIAILTEFGE